MIEHVTRTLRLRVEHGLDRPACWTAAPVGSDLDDRAPSSGMVDILIAGENRTWSSTQYSVSAVGRRLRYVSHALAVSGPWHTVTVEQRDVDTGLLVASELTMHDDIPAVRSRTRVRNNGTTAVTLHAVTSLLFSGFRRQSRQDADGYTLTRGENAWLAEGRWQHQPLRTVLPALAADDQPLRTRNAVRAVSTASASTANDLPTAFLTHEDGAGWGWQIEHNGGWTWQLSETNDGLHLALLGPTDEEHQFARTLQPGDAFETAAACLTFSDAGFDSVVDALTGMRRASRQATDTPLALVFNDYMNTLNGDPTTDRLLPLIDAAADSGAEYFCIDAGWYDDRSTWWDAVGEWTPSIRRFPGGIDEVLDRIRDRGMVPGLWLEPEVIGVNSRMFDVLPPEAFLQRDGRPTVEDGRYHLDFTHPAARSHVDSVVDRLVSRHRIGYLKLDYNIRSIGTDVAGRAVGDGLLRHCRAVTDWLDVLRSRHPQLILENCASGAMRSDQAMLSRTHLQSTSDQEDAIRYAPIAASAPLMMPPEQAANWAYPADWMSPELATLTLVNGLAGRLYLSGFLHRLPAGHRELVCQAVTAYKTMRRTLGERAPFWPLGLPQWSSPWIALGLQSKDRSDALLYLWYRPRDNESSSIKINLGHVPAWHHVEFAFPEEPGEWTAELAAGTLTIRASTAEASARILRLKTAAKVNEVVRAGI